MANSRGGRGKKGGRRRQGNLEPDQIRALNHRLRRRILRALHASGEPSSPTRIAKRLGVGLNNSSYHMKVLAGFGTVEKADEQQVRGTIEHFYTSKVADNPNVLEILEATKDADEAD